MSEIRTKGWRDTGPTDSFSGLANQPPSHDSVGRVRDSLFPALVVTGLLVLTIHAGLGIVKSDRLLSGGLLDTDAYTRLVRVLDLWHSGDWFDPVLARVSPPDGLASHWTRPMDLLLIVGALALSPILGFEQGLHWWGVAVSPLLHIAAALAMIWAARPLLRRDQLWLLGILFAVQPGVIGYLQFGRPDHHGLLILAAVIYLGGALRMLAPEARPRDALGTGLIGAFGLWVSIQFLPVLVLPMIPLGLLWLAGEDWAAGAARRLSAGLVLGTAAALVIERGWVRLDAMEFDTLSIAHLLLFVLTLAFWSAMEILPGRRARRLGPRERLAFALSGAGLMLGLLWLLAPGFFASPLADVDSLYRAKRLIRIKELQPAILFGPDGAWNWGRSVARPVFWLGIALPAVPWLLYRLRSGASTERHFYALLGLGIAVFLPLTLYQLRWAPYAAIFLVPVYAVVSAALLDFLVSGIRPALIPLARPLAVVVLGLWVTIPSGWSKSEAIAGDAAPNAPTCRAEALTSWLGAAQSAGHAPKYVLVYPDIGPLVLYRTPHSVTAIPNHRLQTGFTAAYRIMTATDFVEAERLLRTRGIDLIATCPGPQENALYDADTDRPTLYRSLKEDRPPAFLERVGPSEENLGLYLVYSVIEGSTQGEDET